MTVFSMVIMYQVENFQQETVRKINRKTQMENILQNTFFVDKIHVKVRCQIQDISKQQFCR